MVPRGRVELPTPAFSGPRSTGELPRHRYNTRFYGKEAACERKKRTTGNCHGVTEAQRKLEPAPYRLRPYPLGELTALAGAGSLAEHNALASG